MTGLFEFNRFVHINLGTFGNVDGSQLNPPKKFKRVQSTKERLPLHVKAEPTFSKKTIQDLDQKENDFKVHN